jgi:predicted nucleotidyltransferase
MAIRTIRSSPVAKKDMVKLVSKAASLIRADPPARKLARKETPAAMSAAKRVAKFLRRQGARRVLVFGSLVKGTYVAGNSDIDLFFDGVPAGKESLVTGRTLLAFPDLRLDLRPAGFCEAHFREEIEESGLAI